MPTLRIGQTNFSAGEFSPLLQARSDVSLYRNGAETLSNFRLHYQGGVAVRYGLRYLATLAYSSIKLVPFVFSPSQAYIFSFSNTRVDIYDTDGAAVTSLTSAPWTTAMLERLNWAQQGDTMIVVHPDMATQVIKRTGASTFTRAAYAFEATSTAGLYQPYFKFADPTMTLTPGATTGTGISLALSGAGAFVAGHVGVIIRHKGKQILVATVTNATTATGDVLDTLTDTSAATDWDEAVFSAVRGYANSVTWFGDRLWFGGSKSHPIGIWASKIGAYFNFDLGTTLDNEAIWENAPATLLSEIRHLLDFRHLLIYGDQGLFYVPSSPSSPVTPTNFQVVRQQPYGASYVRPQDFDGAAAYVQTSGLVAREGYWIDTDQAYTANPISGLAAHLIDSPTEVAASYGGLVSQDEAYLLLVNGDGNLSVFHSVRSEKMASWVPWSTEGTFVGICATPGKIFVAVSRTIAAGAVVTLEVFDEERAPLDCLKRVTGSASRTFSGFSYLDGIEVDVVSKGHYLGQYTPASGTITLNDSDPEVTEIEAGFGFEPTLKPMPVDFDLQDGPARGLFKRLIRCLLTVDSLEGLTVQGRNWLPDFQGDDFATAAPTKTGVIEMRVKGVNREGQFEIKIPRGRKGTILGLARHVHVGK